MIQGVTRQLSDTELALKIEREHTNARTWNSKNFQRSVENWQMYWGNDNEKGFGQWPSDAAAEMIRQGRQVATFNICRPTLDNIAGGIMKAPFGFDFSPVDNAISSLTYKIKDIQYTEWELMDVRSHELEMVIGGLTCQSTMEMYLSSEYSSSKNPNQRNIGLRTLPPLSVIYDPKWRSPRSKDCKKAYKESWLSPMQMLEIYSENRNKIIQAVMFKKLGKDYLKNFAHIQFEYGDEYGQNIGIIPYAENDEMWGSQYKVVEFYHMEKMKVKFEYVLTEDEKKIRIPGYLKDAAEKIEWLNQTVPGWIPDQIFEEECEEEVQIVSTICPGLMHGLLLQNGPTEIQCGRLQFFPWSAYRANGEFGGIIDAIKDIQFSINNLESLLTHKLQIEGGGGAQYVDPTMFWDNDEYEKWVNGRNNPGLVFRMKTGALLRLPSGPATPVKKSPYPAEAMDRLTHLIEVMLPKVSKVSPASRGESETTNESGYLFKLKKIQSEIEQYTIYEGLRNFWNEVGEAYLNQCIITHGNGVEREFYNPRTKNSFKINERKEIDDGYGGIIEVILDNLSDLKDIRHRVNVVESDESPTRKMEIVQSASDLKKNVDPNMNPLTYNDLLHKIMTNLDIFSPEEKKTIEGKYQLEEEAATQALKTKIAVDKATEYESNIKIMQMSMSNVQNGSGQQLSPAGQAPAPPQENGMQLPQGGGGADIGNDLQPVEMSMAA